MVIRFLIHAAGLVWPIALALVLQLVTFRLLKDTDRRFQQVTAGLQTFDFQNRLSADDISAQLPLYTGESRRLYERFFVLDFFFPLFAALFLGLLWAALLSAFDFTLYAQLLAWHAPLIPLLPTLFDWGENLCFRRLVRAGPPPSPALARTGVVFKRLKLVSLAIVFAATAGLVLVSAAAWLSGAG